MTETFRQQQDRLFNERVQREADIKRRREEWERNEEAKKELARIEGQRAELERHLTERGMRYLERTGAQPSADLVATWTDEYAAGREREHQAEREQRFEQAAANDGIF